MNLPFTLEFGLRPLLGKSRREEKNRPLAGAIAGIALSLIPLVLVFLVADGMIEGITGRTIETDSYHIQLFSYRDSDTIDSLKETLKVMDQVIYAGVEKTGGGMAYSRDGRAGIQLRGLQPNMYQEDHGFRSYIEFREGSWDLSEPDYALLGVDIAERLKVQVGDSVKILTGRTFSGNRFIPKITEMTVKGIFTSGYQELDKLWVVIPLETGRSILSGGGTRSFIGLKIQDPYTGLDQVLNPVRSVLPSGWDLKTWKSLNRSQQKNLETTRMMLTFIMVLIVLVAVVNISSSLTMLVLSRQEEIALLKSLGATPGMISRSFLFSGTFAGIIGALIGVSAGVLTGLGINRILMIIEWSVNLVNFLFSGLSGREFQTVTLLNESYYLESIPIHLDWSSLVLVFVSTVVLATLASWVPARKAGLMKPLEILHKV